MTQLVFKQFEMARGWFIEVAESISKEEGNVQPKGFNNNIHWHIGHVLTACEQLIFGLPEETNHLPDNYIKLFETGTKPANWKGNIPGVDKLIIQLEDQLERYKQIPSERFNKTLEKPFFGLETFEELAGFVNVHEAIHIGKIEEMKRIIEFEGFKN
jgi:hypothetical protein